MIKIVNVLNVIQRRRNKMFAQKFQEDSEKKYELRKQQKYGESWKIMSVNDLRRRLMDEIKEWRAVIFCEESGSTTLEQEYDELMDIRNFCSMIGERIRKPNSQFQNKKN